MNFVHSPEIQTPIEMMKDLSSLRDKIRQRGLILAKRRALRVVEELDPDTDLQAQIRSPLHIDLKEYLRPKLHERNLSNKKRKEGKKLVIETSSSRDELSPIFDRLSSPENFTGIYRRRCERKERSNTGAFARTNHVENLITGSSGKRNGGTGLGTSQTMRPWLDLKNGKAHPTTLAFSDHEVKRRATLLNLKKYEDVYRQNYEDSKQDDPAFRTLAAKHKFKRISSSQKQSCFDRLSNVSSYTGIHKHRFDTSTSKGLGKAGSSSSAKGLGYIPGGQRVNVLLRPQRKATKARSHYKPAPKNPNVVKHAARKEVQEILRHAGYTNSPMCFEEENAPYRTPPLLGGRYWELSDPTVDHSALRMDFSDFHKIHKNRTDS